MTDEEKEAIAYLNADVEYLQEELKNPNYIGRFITIQDKEFKYLKTILNLIEKQQKHLAFYEKDESYKARILELKAQLEKKDKVINEMAEYLAIVRDCPNEDFGRNLDIFLGNKINQLLKAVKQLDTKINKLESED